ncbi:MAG: hypothetical protein J0I41_12720 [Filimonas sp.]|nr:hypothetical protein [Filimonas sp.]
MQRVGTLIHKLLEQYQQEAGTGSMLITAQMLLAELQQAKQQVTETTGKKIAVVLPVTHNVLVITEEIAKAAKDITIIPEAIHPVVETIEIEEPKVVEVIEEVKEPEKAPEPVLRAVKDDAPVPQPSFNYDPVRDVPTLSLQPKESVELNDTINDNKESLNEKLRVEKIELASMLHEAPIRDLKKAIGINDRYLFINELFRGDETMYERSIKTINGFNIFPEAQYWIQRELKLKLGWNDNSDTVHHFDQLVRRRFA